MAALLDPLSTEEQTIVLPTLIKFLKRNTNDNQSITSDKIIGWFQKYQDRIGFKAAFNKQRLMKLINHIRMHNLLSLHSGGNGYCVTIRPDRIQELIDEFQSRVDSHIAMMNALKKTKADLELEIQVRAFDEAKKRRESYKPKVKKIDTNDIFDTIDDFKGIEDLFR